MRMQTLKKAGSIAVLGALLTVACGDSASSLSPTAPSAAVVSGAVSADASAASAASGPKPPKPNDNRGPSTPAPPTNGSPVGPVLPTNPITGKVQIEGLIASVTGTSITVNGQTVVVPVTAVIRHGSRAVAFSELRVGDRVHVKASMQGTALEATEVKLQNPAGDDDDDGDDDATGGSVRVSLLDATASESGTDTGTFRLTRVASATLPLTSPLTVTFTLTGTALNGTDYQNTPATATFLAGQATADVVVTPLADVVAEGPETVILTLTIVAPYVLGSPISATVTIADMPVVTVLAVDPSASEAGPDPGTFRFTRAGNTAPALTVTYTVSGTAANGVDYQNIPVTVTFPAGQATADVVITPIDDAVAEVPETVILTLTDGPLYDLGVQTTATVTIAG